MLSLQIVLIFFYLIWAYNITKAQNLLRSIVFFVVIMYGFQLVLACADPYNYYPVSSLTILMFNVQIICILIGCAIGVNKGRFNKIFDKEKIFDFRITSFLLIVQTVVLALSFYRFRKVQSYIMLNLAADARDFYFSEMYSSYTEELIVTFFDAFVYVSYFLAFSLLFFNKKKNGLKEYYIIISTFAIVILKTLTSMGRGVIFQLFIVFLLFLLYSYSYEKKIYKRKVRPVAIVLIGMVAVLIGAATLARFNLEESDVLLDNLDEFLYKPFATYFYVPVCAFDYGKDHVFGSLVPMFGAADLAAPIDLLLTPIRFFDQSIESINNTLGAKMSPQFFFPSGNKWNALFTGASNYYIDFGYLGFIIFPLLHGYILASVEKRSRHSGAWFAVLLFIFLASFNHMKSSGIQSLSTVFVFFWIYYVAKLRIVTK